MNRVTHSVTCAVVKDHPNASITFIRLILSQKKLEQVKTTTEKKEKQGRYHHKAGQIHQIPTLRRCIVDHDQHSLVHVQFLPDVQVCGGCDVGGCSFSRQGVAFVQKRW